MHRRRQPLLSDLSTSWTLRGFFVIIIIIITTKSILQGKSWALVHVTGGYRKESLAKRPCSILSSRRETRRSRSHNSVHRQLRHIGTSEWLLCFCAGGRNNRAMSRGDGITMWAEPSLRCTGTFLNISRELRWNIIITTTTLRSRREWASTREIWGSHASRAIIQPAVPNTGSEAQSGKVLQLPCKTTHA